MCEVVGIGQLLNDVEMDREKVAEEKSEVLDVLLVSSIALLIELFQVGLDWHCSCDHRQSLCKHLDKFLVIGELLTQLQTSDLC